MHALAYWFWLLKKRLQYYTGNNYCLNAFSGSWIWYPSIENTRHVYKYKTGWSFLHQKSSTWIGFLMFCQAILNYVPKQAFSVLCVVFSYNWSKSWWKNWQPVLYWYTGFVILIDWYSCVNMYACPTKTEKLCKL